MHQCRPPLVIFVKWCDSLQRLHIQKRLHVTKVRIQKNLRLWNQKCDLGISLKPLFLIQHSDPLICLREKGDRREGLSSVATAL